jgi:chemotaxis protein MotB
VEAASAPAWTVTYGDMMSLLLAFFVLLAAFSTISERKLSQAVVSLQGAFGALPGGAGVLPEGPAVRPTAAIENVARDLQRKMQVLGQDEEIKIQYDKEGGLRIVLPNRFLFDTASAEVKEESRPVLQSVGELLSNVPGGFIEVRGHTDSRPLVNSAKYRDNYDLSYARADNIARRIQKYGRLPIEQFEIVACGPGQPVATNDTEEGKQANRRVEILVRAGDENGGMGKLKDEVGGSAPAAVPASSTAP